jgi:hypothetical protein
MLTAFWRAEATPMARLGYGPPFRAGGDAPRMARIVIVTDKPSPIREALPDHLVPHDKMTFAIGAAIVGASPVSNDGTVAVNLDVALSALAWMIAAIGVQAKSVDNQPSAKAFVEQIAEAIEQNLEALRASDDREPFPPVSAIFRNDPRH